MRSITQTGDERPSRIAIEEFEEFYNAKPPRWWLRARHRTYSVDISSKATRTPSRAKREGKTRDVGISRNKEEGDKESTA
jgi:hypothetical protein